MLALFHKLLKARATKYFKRERKGNKYVYYYTEAQYNKAKGKGADKKEDTKKSVKSYDEYYKNLSAEEFKKLREEAIKTIKEKGSTDSAAKYYEAKLDKMSSKVLKSTAGYEAQYKYGILAGKEYYISKDRLTDKGKGKVFGADVKLDPKKVAEAKKSTEEVKKMVGGSPEAKQKEAQRSGKSGGNKQPLTSKGVDAPFKKAGKVTDKWGKGSTRYTSDSGLEVHVSKIGSQMYGSVVHSATGLGATMATNYPIKSVEGFLKKVQEYGKQLNWKSANIQDQIENMSSEDRNKVQSAMAALKK